MNEETQAKGVLETIRERARLPGVTVSLCGVACAAVYGLHRLAGWDAEARGALVCECVLVASGFIINLFDRRA